MTEKELDKLDNKETIAMLKEIDDNYSSLDLPIVEPKYNKNGELTNEKEVKKSLKLILPILLVLWEQNIAITTAKSIKVMTNTNLYVNTLKTGLKLPKTTISVKEWNNIMGKLIKDRQKKVKIKQVIRGNANRLNKQVQDTVLKMYKNGKNYKQTAKELQKQFGYNKNKAKSIAITEKNYYKSEAQLQAIDNISENIKKIWVYTGRAKEPREEHLQADGQVADKKGYFHIGGLKTKAPQHFGRADQDINCMCIMRIEKINK
jgi:hypothetical protein